MFLPRLNIYLAALLFACCPLHIYAQTRVPTPADSRRAQDTVLDASVRREITAFKGKVSLYAKNLDTGASYGVNADERVRTASTIKTAIMVEAFARVSEGHAKWSDEIVLTKEKKVPGAGVLQEMADGLHLTLRDAVNLMMTVSDNTATNLVLDVLTTDAVNRRMDALGLKKTRSLQKIGGAGKSHAAEDPVNKNFGIGVTTPREMVTLLEKLAQGEIVSASVSKEMIDLMKREQSREGIGRTLWRVPKATKSGALDHLRSDVGIFYTARGRIALAITCDDIPEIEWTIDNPGRLLASRLSLLLIAGLGSEKTQASEGAKQ